MDQGCGSGGDASFADWPAWAKSWPGGKGLSSGWARPEGCRCGGGWLGWQVAEREEGQDPGRNPIFSHRFPDGNPIFPDENFRCWKISGRKKTNTENFRTPFGQPEAQKSWKNIAF